MKILLGVTGSVATTLTEKMVVALQNQGHEVRVVMTFSALYFQKRPWWLIARQVLQAKFGLGQMKIGGASLFTDFIEWPSFRYRKNQDIPHIALRDWADAMVIAPLSANTLAKAANGICDNLLTCVLRAWDRSKPLIIAPAMNTKMWEHPATVEHLEKLKRWYDLRVVPPVARKLACGDVGVGAMADVADIVKSVVIE